MDTAVSGTDIFASQGSSSHTNRRASTCRACGFFFSLGEFCLVLWPIYVAFLRVRVHVFLEYLAIDALEYSRAPDLARGRGDTPRWGLMAGSAACCTTYNRHFPLVPVQRQSNELPATTVGECRRRHSLRRHKGGRWTVRLTSRHRVLQGGF